LSIDAQSGHLVEAYVDGACIPKNPGGIPVWGFLLLKDNIPIETKGGLAGAESSPRATNNVAEYEAIINALKQIKRLGWDRDKIVAYTDSRIVYSQLKDEWKAGPALDPWYKRAKALMNGFPFFELRWIPGNQNRVAHRATRAAYYEVRLAQLKKG
jgi:ribonuclease HI